MNAVESPATLPHGPKLNLGCGPVQPDSWVNVDGSNRAKLASWTPWIDRILTRLKVIPPTEFSARTKVLNLFKPLPFQDNTVSCIYAGELWEHFEYNDAARLTKECYRVLAPGGVLRVCVPDGVEFWQNYLNKFYEQQALPENERSDKALRQHTAMFFRDICTRRKLLGSMGHTHKWQYDEIQLVTLFRNVGFESVSRMPFHVSKISDVDHVEGSNYLIVEGTKP